MTVKSVLKNGIFDNNPTFVQVIGMCPVLAVTTSANNGIGMGLATTTVLACANLVISLVRNVIPDKVRIPSFVVIIAAFGTIVKFLLEAYFQDLNHSLGIFIPLIVVNCIILARVESFASKNKPFLSFIDGIGMGIGFTVSLALVGIIREFVGARTFFDMEIPIEWLPKTVLMILPPGAFITLGCLMAFLTYIKRRRNHMDNK